MEDVKWNKLASNILHLTFRRICSAGFVPQDLFHVKQSTCIICKISQLQKRTKTNPITKEQWNSTIKIY